MRDLFSRPKKQLRFALEWLCLKSFQLWSVSFRRARQIIQPSTVHPSNNTTPTHSKSCYVLWLVARRWGCQRFIVQYLRFPENKKGTERSRMRWLLVENVVLWGYVKSHFAVGRWWMWFPSSPPRLPAVRIERVAISRLQWIIVQKIVSKPRSW